MFDPMTAIVLVIVLFLNNHTTVSRVVEEETYGDCQVDADEVTKSLVGQKFTEDKAAYGAQVVEGTVILDVKTRCMTFYQDVPA